MGVPENFTTWPNRNLRGIQCNVLNQSISPAEQGGGQSKLEVKTVPLKEISLLIDLPDLVNDKVDNSNQHDHDKVI